MNLSAFRTLESQGVLNCDSYLPSWVHCLSTGPSFHALWVCVPLYTSLYVHNVPNILPRSLCSWPCKSLHLLVEGQNHLIVCFAYLPVCHMIGKEFVFLFFLYTKLFKPDVEVAFINKSVVTHCKVNLLLFPLWSSCSERTDNAFVLIICFCFFHL